MDPLKLRQGQQDRHCPQLVHLFAAGLRFETEVRYRVRQGAGTHGRHRYRDRLLPLQRPTTLQGEGDDGAGHGERLGLVQCAAVLQQALPDWGEPPDLRMEALVSASPRDIGAAALDALQAGQMALVQFETPKACRWALVAGVEAFVKQRFVKATVRTSNSSKDTEQVQVRALLLLDPKASAPWGSAYNARLELQGRAGRSDCSDRGSSAKPKALRFSTGETWAVRLCQLVVLGAP